MWTKDTGESTYTIPLPLSSSQSGSFAVAGIAGVIQFSDCKIVRHIPVAVLYLQNISEYATEWHCAMDAPSAVLSFVPFYFSLFRSLSITIIIASLHSHATCMMRGVQYWILIVIHKFTYWFQAFTHISSTPCQTYSTNVRSLLLFPN